MDSAFFIALSCFLFVCAWLSEASLFFSLLLILWLIRLVFLKSKPVWLGTLIVGALISVRLIVVTSQRQIILKPQTVSVAATVDLKSIKVNGDFLQATVKTKRKQKLQLQYTLKSQKEKQLWQNLERTPQVKIEGKTEKIAENGNFYPFEYGDYLDRQGICGLLKAQTLKVISTKFSAWGFVHHYLLKVIKKCPQELHSFLRLFILGENHFETDILQVYRALGIVHLLSISGLHLLFFKRFLQQLLLRLQITHETTDSLLIAFFIGYGFLTQWPVSIFRASWQLILRMLAKRTGHYLSRLSAWSYTLLFCLFLFPYRIFSVGFQLSFLVSFLLIVMSEWQWLKELSSFKQATVMSLFCSLVSAPILSYHFFEFSYFTLVANSIFVPIFSYIIFPMTLVLFGIAFISPTFLNFLSVPAVKFAAWFHQVLNVTSKLNAWTFVTGRLPLFIYFLLFVLILSMLQSVEQGKWPKLRAMLAITILLSYQQWNPWGVVGMIDVGQGDAFFIKTPFKRSVTLIDTGGRLQIPKEAWQISHKQVAWSQKNVIPALKAQGISTIDRLVLTHPDVDHVGELAEIAKALKIKELILTETALKDQWLQQTLNQIPYQKIQTVKAGDTLANQLPHLHVIHPQQKQADKNEDSIVIWTKIGGLRWLFTGDAGLSSENEWLTRYPKLKVDILKVGHHGSKHSTSKELLAQIEASMAWISVGRNNRYQHPTSEVLERLEQAKVKVYRTDQQGAVYYYYLKLPFANPTWNQLKYKRVPK